VSRAAHAHAARTDAERAGWIDVRLPAWRASWQASGQPIAQFVRLNRDELDETIDAVLATGKIRR
jgi:hypothetical protein